MRMTAWSLLLFLMSIVFPVDAAEPLCREIKSESTKSAQVSDSIRLVFSGVLGQSQPQDKPALHFNSVLGLFVDGRDQLWVLPPGKDIYQFAPAAKSGSMGDAESPYVFVKAIGLPASAQYASGLTWDLERAYVIGTDWNLYAFDPEPETWRLCFRIQDETVRRYQAFCVQPVSAVESATTGSSHTAETRFLFRCDDQILAYDDAGNGPVRLLTLPALRNCGYGPVGFSADGQGILVGSGYPDMKAYRFSASGGQMCNMDWPAPGFFIAFSNTQGNTWGLLAGGQAKALSGTTPSRARAMLSAAWTHPSRAVAQNAQRNRTWVACTQGIVEYQTAEEPVRRIGGLAEIDQFAINPQGDIVAIAERQSRLLRLGWADQMDAPLSCLGNEPFRPGGGWRSRASGIAWRHPDFLVLDSVEKKLWRFNPDKIGYGQNAWVGMTASNAFMNPKAIACGDSAVWVLDETKLYSLLIENDRVTAITTILDDLPEDARLIAATVDDTCLAIAGKDWVRVFSVCVKDDSLRGVTPVWSRSLDAGSIGGLAVTDGGVVVSDREHRQILLWDQKLGADQCRFQSGECGIDFHPEEIAARGVWVIVGDPTSSRLLRFRLVHN